MGYDWAAAQTRLGISSPNPISASRRGDEVLRLKPMFQREPVSIAECFAFCSETTFFMKGLRLGLCPKPQQGTCSLHPFSASQRFKQGFLGQGWVHITEKTAQNTV